MEAEMLVSNQFRPCSCCGERFPTTDVVNDRECKACIGQIEKHAKAMEAKERKKSRPLCNGCFKRAVERPRRKCEKCLKAGLARTVVKRAKLRKDKRMGKVKKSLQKVAG